MQLLAELKIFRKCYFSCALQKKQHLIFNRPSIILTYIFIGFFSPSACIVMLGSVILLHSYTVTNVGFFYNSCYSNYYSYITTDFRLNNTPDTLQSKHISYSSGFFLSVWTMLSVFLYILQQHTHLGSCPSALKNPTALASSKIPALHSISQVTRDQM